MDYNHDFPSAGMIHIRIHSVCVCACVFAIFITCNIYAYIYNHIYPLLKYLGYGQTSMDGFDVLKKLVVRNVGSKTPRSDLQGPNA